MPSTIPYDPALTLGNIVPQGLLDNLLKMAEIQEPIDTAQFELNDKIALKDSIRATTLELRTMGVDTSKLEKKGDDVGKLITEAAVKYADTRVEQEEKLQGLRKKNVSLHESEESPVDWNRTQITKRPIGSDSMKMDVQYFAFDENEQEADNSIANIKKFLTVTTGGWLDASKGADIAKSAIQQVTSQREHHDIAGTLILSATCTHKNAALLAPFILDVDKAIRTWNATYIEDTEKIDVFNRDRMAALARKANTSKEKSIPVISGATFGSSFVGMVHVLRRTETETDQDIESMTKSLQGQMSIALWFSDTGGSFGVEKTLGQDIKNVLSTARVDSHVSLITAGVIPSIAANDVEMAVKEFTKFDPQTMMNNLVTLANGTQADQKTMQRSAADARIGQQLVEWQGGTIQNVISSVGVISTEKDKIINVQSMITAFEDYVKKAIAGEIGVPINYYVKHVTASQLAQMWLSKYYPTRFMAISGDDSTLNAPAPTRSTETTASSGSNSGTSDGTSSDDTASDGSSGSGDGNSST